MSGVTIARWWTPSQVGAGGRSVVDPEGAASTMSLTLPVSQHLSRVVGRSVTRNLTQRLLPVLRRTA